MEGGNPLFYYKEFLPMRIFSYIVAIVLILFGLTFALLNARPVELNYYLGTIKISLSLLLIFTVGLGILIGVIFSLGSWIRLKRKNFQLRSRIKQLEHEVLAIKIPETEGLQK